MRLFSSMQERDALLEDPNYNAALPAAGAFTDQAIQVWPAARFPRRLSILCTYTKHASATSNQCKLRVQWQINSSATRYFETFINTASPTVGDPYAEMPEYALTLVSPEIAAADSPFSFRALSLEVPSGATGVRVLAAESGDTTNPGTLRIDLAVSDVL